MRGLRARDHVNEFATDTTGTNKLNRLYRPLDIRATTIVNRRSRAGHSMLGSLFARLERQLSRFSHR